MEIEWDIDIEPNHELSMISHDCLGMSEHGIPTLYGHLDVENHDEPLDLNLGVSNFQTNPFPVWRTYCILVERCMGWVGELQPRNSQKR